MSFTHIESVLGSNTFAQSAEAGDLLIGTVSLATASDNSGTQVPAGWKYGYNMGANQSGYAEATEFLLDDFNLSTESLL